MDKELKRRFDIVCSWKEVSMSQIAGELIEEWLKKNTPPGLFDSKEKTPDTLKRQG